MKSIFYAALLSFFWMLIVGTIDFGQFLLGLMIGGLIVLFLRPTLNLHTRMTWSELIRWPWPFVAYSLIFLKDLTLANLDVAKRILTPSLPVKPGIVRVQVPTQTDLGTTLVANAITLTPGTITLEVKEDERGNFFYIHAIDVSNPEAIKKDVQEKYQNWQRRVFS